MLGNLCHRRPALVLGRIFHVIHEEGVPVFYDTDHRFTGIQFDFVSVVIIVSCRAVIGGFFPGNMDAPAVRKIPAVSCCIMALEGEITFLVTHFKVGILNQDIFEGQLFIIGFVDMWAVCRAG